MVDRQFMHNGTATVVAGEGGMNGGVAIISAAAAPVNNHNGEKWVQTKNFPKKEQRVKGKRIQVKDDMTTMDRIVLFMSELFATAILIFLGCMGCVKDIAGGFIPHEQISLTFGLAVMVSIQVFGHISGSHINPIVTVAAATLGNISLIQVPIYFLGQLIGAIVGFGLLKLSTPAKFMGNVITASVNGTLVKSAGVCSPEINPEITTLQGFLVEFLATLILAFVCCGVWDQRNTNKSDSVPIRFGLAIAVLALATGPYTGAHMNPARSFAPAFFNGDWKDHWVYWVAPLSAGFLGALVYRLIFTKNPPPKAEDFAEEMPLNENNKA